MNDQSQSDRLLDDVLVDALKPGFREALLEQTLGQVRRRRRVRRAQRGALAVALVLGCSLALWRGIPLGRTRPPGPVACGRVLTRPLDSQQIVETKAGAATIISTSPDRVAQFATVAGSKPFREFSDLDLLSFFSGKPVVLVSVAPRQAELVFLHPADADGFPMR